MLGTGVVVYTFILVARVKREDRPGPAPATPGPPDSTPPRSEPFFGDERSANMSAAGTAGGATGASSASFASADDVSGSTPDAPASQPAGTDARAESPQSAGAQFEGSHADSTSTSEARTSSANAGGAHGGRSQSPPPPGGSAPASIAAASLPRAGFGIRMAALLIDIVLVAVILSIVFDDHDYMLLFLAGYGAAMWKLRSTTIGGIVCNLQVVRLDGRPIDWSTAIVRALSCFLSLVAAGLGFIWIIFDDGRQAWHDKIAGTAVVRVPKGIPLV
jgi:uncharacterized RDD family membrane protein YckC